ncbi:hypothetical protein [Mucilaginibacter arboris]|uniref:Uncharacterized protein n=1 Tax=Mucilaginibacter arboris TaxID=2682090 RepID=A0A7K1SWV1_9SPHI|nr:hypothetical protein [Mucilaginibacter arboris]MVN21789.1 hypothetical protein [Mucilaginibacter arboris]
MRLPIHMTTTRLLLLLTILQAFIVTSCKQTNSIIPNEFHETVLPKIGSNEWYSVNYSQNSFSVNIANEKLKIEQVKEINKCELKITGGTLVRINRGEWGGKLTFKPADTTKKAIEIKSGNIKYIFNFKNKIYFIEGLAHDGYSEGAIFELNKQNDNFTFTKLVDFDDAPEALAIYKNKFFIATYKNFYIIQNFKKDLIFNDAFWSGLYPNSIAVLDEKNVFLGIRSGIAKLDLINKTLKFYKYEK